MTTTKPKKKFNVFKPVITIIIILLLLILGIIGWQTYQTKQQLTFLQNNLQQIQSTLVQQDNTLQNLQAKLHQTNLTLPEVKYLINLANINLIINDNLPVAIKLLQIADQHLATLNDSTLNDLRRTLANDISALQAVPKVDVVGIILRLDAINNQVSHLALIPRMPTTQPTTAAQSIPTKAKSKWQRFYQTSLLELQGIVIIRHHPTEMQPVLTETQQTYLIQNINLALEQAKWAVLHKSSKDYRAALQQVNQLIQFGFAHNLTAAQPILNSLQKLQQIDINPAIPKLSAMQQLTGKASS